MFVEKSSLLKVNCCCMYTTSACLIVCNNMIYYSKSKYIAMWNNVFKMKKLLRIKRKYFIINCTKTTILQFIIWLTIVKEEKRKHKTEYSKYSDSKEIKNLITPAVTYLNMQFYLLSEQNLLKMKLIWWKYTWNDP